jgi:hypothetical protein
VRVTEELNEAEMAALKQVVNRHRDVLDNFERDVLEKIVRKVEAERDGGS